MANKNFTTILAELKKCPLPKSQCSEFLNHFEELIENDCDDTVIFGAMFYEFGLLNLSNYDNLQIQGFHWKIRDLLFRSNDPTANFSQIMDASKSTKFIPAYYSLLLDKQRADKYKDQIIKWKEIAEHSPILNYDFERQDSPDAYNPVLFIMSELKKYTGTSIQRTSFIRLMEVLTQQKVPMGILIGALYFELEVCKPNLFGKGTLQSTLHVIITSILSHIKNPLFPNESLNELDQLIFMRIFYDYLIEQRNGPIESLMPVKGTQWESYGDLLKDVRENLRVTIENEDKKINKILAEQFSTEVLLKKLGKMLKGFDGKKLSIEEDKLLRMLSLLHTRFKTNLQRMNDPGNEELKETYELELYAMKKTLLGAVIFIVLALADPKSDLQKECLVIGNFKNVDNDFEKKWVIRQLESLLYELDNLKQSDLADEVEKIKKKYDEKQSAVEWGIKGALSSGFRYGFSLFTSSSIVTGALLYLGASVNPFLGAVAVVTFKAGVWIVEFSKDVVPEISATGLSYLLNNVSDGASEKTVEGAKYYIKATRENLANAIKLCQENNPEFKEFQASKKEPRNKALWLNTLVRLPTDIFSEENREKIRCIFGFDQKTQQLNQEAVNKYSIHLGM